MAMDDAAFRVSKRAYQACIPCQRRKVRCIRVERDGNFEASCVRCKRERKECIFAPERSKKASGRFQEQPSLRGGPQGSVGSASSDLTDRLANTVVSNQVEALNLLFEAAEGSSVVEAIANEAPRDGTSVRYHASRGEPDALSSHDDAYSSPGGYAQWMAPTYPISQPSEETIKAWSALGFVKKKWFTAVEAVTYVDLFFRNMSPLSPILSDFYSHHSNCITFVKSEPVLCTTILTLSSRYHPLKGDGWLSRSYFVHNRLWRYCQSLLQRVMWGQEKEATSRTRALGTVEGLLLMAEWHARSLHFPPDIEAWDSEEDGHDISHEKETSSVPPNRWLEGVVEPAKRSDRMSWALLQAAASLANELSVFDESKDGGPTGSGESIDSSTESFAVFRRRRLRILLYVYINQWAIKTGSTSLIPNVLLTVPPIAAEAGPAASPDREWLGLMSLHVDLTRLMRTSSDLLFPSKATTRDLVLKGSYSIIIEYFEPMLEAWWAKYQVLSAPRVLKDMLSIDFRYTKIYIFSLALQAIAERKMTFRFTDGAPDAFLSSIVDLHPGDYECVQDVINGSKMILGIILRFAASAHLKFLPARIYTRTVAACIFLLKALALGVRTEELNSSLDLIDQSARALRSHVVDDLHLAGIFASLLEKHTLRFRERFVRVCKLSTVPDLRAHNPNSTAQRTLNHPINDAHGESGAFQPTINGLDDAAAEERNGTTQVVNEISLMDEDWLALPFDSTIAPFGVGVTQSTWDFHDETLNFIWNLDN